MSPITRRPGRRFLRGLLLTLLALIGLAAIAGGTLWIIARDALGALEIENRVALGAE